MKKIAIIFGCFFFLAAGILLFFVSQSQKVQTTSSRATEERSMTLKAIVDDCNVQFHFECVPPGGLSNSAIMESIVESVLRSQPNSALLSYKEKYFPVDYPTLLGGEQANQVELSVPQMITKVSQNTLVTYQLLLTLIAVENPSFFSNTDGNVKHPYGLSSPSLLAEFNDVATVLSANMQNTIDPTLRIQNVTYQMDPDINLGSKVVYSYLASTSKTPEIFERKVKEFPTTWQKVLGDKALTDKPRYLEEKKEQPLPKAADESIPPLDQGDTPIATSSAPLQTPSVQATPAPEKVEDLFR